MKQVLVKFMKDQRFFTGIYVLAFLCVILFYQMTVTGAEVIYPVMIALFFYLVYLIVSLICYLCHLRNLDRLQKNAVSVHSGSMQEQAAYDALQVVHHNYGIQIAALKHEHTEEQRFTSAFIHNLKTPAAVSSIILQRCRQGEITQEQALSDLDHETNRMTDRLNTLLDLQRLTELQNDYEPKAVSLKEEVTRVINENKSLFIHNHVYPKAQIPDGLILTDPKWNRILLNQIISNAVKYSAKEGETKYLYFYIDENNRQDQTIRLVIEDQGIGIPSYDLARVCEAFFTGDNGREGYNSSGIGLYLCKQICEKLDQELTIANVYDQKDDQKDIYKDIHKNVHGKETVACTEQSENEHPSGCKVTITYLSKL